MNHSFAALLVRWLVLALGVILATKLVDGISCDDGSTLFVVVLLLSFFNAVLKPVLLLFTLPFILLTMGLGVIVINALLFLAVGKLVDGFHVAGFWPAVWGAIIVSLTHLIVGRFFKTSPRAPSANPPPPSAPSARPPVTRGGDKGDVIDI